MIVKVGRVELLPEECALLLEEGRRYIAAFRSVYVLEYHAAQGLYGARKVYYKNDGVPIVKRGHWIATDAATINRWIDHNLFNED